MLTETLMPSTRKARSTVRVYPEMLTKLCGGTYWQWFSRSCIGRRRVCSKSLFEEHMYTFPYRAVDSLKNTCDGCAMKKLLVFALILLSFLFVSCVTSLDRTLLQHSASSIDPKVPNLELKNETPIFQWEDQIPKLSPQIPASVRYSSVSAKTI